MLKFILLLPCMTCLFWLLSYLFMSPSGRVYKYASFLFLVMFVYYFAAIGPILENGRYVAMATLFEQAFGLLLIPVSISYLKLMYGRDSKTFLLKASYLIPVILFVAECVVMVIVGMNNADSMLADINSGKLTGFSLVDRSATLMYFCSVYAFKGLIAVEYLFFVTLSIMHMMNNHFKFSSFFSFFFKRQSKDVVGVQCGLFMCIVTFNAMMLVLGKSFSADRLWLVYIMCFIHSFFTVIAAILGTVGESVNCSWKDVVSALKFRKPNVEKVVEQPKPTVQTVSSVAFDDTMDLSVRFERLMLQEHLFLDHNISISDVAERMNVDKDALTDMLNDVYGITFATYVNMLRIDYAEQFILNNENATQKYIAQACGFTSASSFNVAFTKYAGVTPKIWKDRYAEMSQRS